MQLEAGKWAQHRQMWSLSPTLVGALTRWNLELECDWSNLSIFRKWGSWVAVTLSNSFQGNCESCNYRSRKASSAQTNVIIESYPGRSIFKVNLRVRVWLESIFRKWGPWVTVTLSTSLQPPRQLPGLKLEELSPDKCGRKLVGVFSGWTLALEFEKWLSLYF